VQRVISSASVNSGVGCLLLVRVPREQHLLATDEDLADFETDLLAGFVMARASAGLADSTIGNDTTPSGADSGLVWPAAVGDAAEGRR
jgi:hypothetical protein